MLLVEKIIDTYKENSKGNGTFRFSNESLFNLTPSDYLKEFNSLTEQEKDCYIDFVLGYKGSEEEKQALKEDLSDGEFSGQGVFKALLDRLDIVIPCYFIYSSFLNTVEKFSDETGKKIKDSLDETANGVKMHYSNLDRLIVSLKNCA